MKFRSKVLLFSLLVQLGLVLPAAAETYRSVAHRQTRYRIKDELASSYTKNDLREMVTRMNKRTQSYVENARKQFLNLLPMDGSSRRSVLNAKEQAAKLKDQQRVRNRIQQDRLSDLRQRNRAMARQRADVKQKIRFDR